MDPFANKTSVTELRYAVHDGTELTLDLYRPEGATDAPRPCVLLIHGGAMRSGERSDLAPWGRYLAGLGYAAASIDYRLARHVNAAYPANILDVAAAIQYLRLRARELGVDGSRIAVLGASSGAYLAAMVVLRRDDPALRDAYPEDPQHGESGAADVALVIAGTYDNIAGWEHDQLHRSDRALETYLGGTPTSARRTYFESSPMFYADTERSAGTRWLIAWGTEDDVVDPTRQSVSFARALKQAGAVVRTCPMPGSSHYWLWHADEDLLEAGRETAYLAPRVRTFLRRWSGWAQRPEENRI